MSADFGAGIGCELRVPVCGRQRDGGHRQEGDGEIPKTRAGAAVQRHGKLQYHCGDTDAQRQHQLLQGGVEAVAELSWDCDPVIATVL